MHVCTVSIFMMKLKLFFFWYSVFEFIYVFNFELIFDEIFVFVQLEHRGLPRIQTFNKNLQ